MLVRRKLVANMRFYVAGRLAVKPMVYLYIIFFELRLEATSFNKLPLVVKYNNRGFFAYCSS